MLFHKSFLTAPGLVSSKLHERPTQCGLTLSKDKRAYDLESTHRRGPGLHSMRQTAASVDGLCRPELCPIAQAISDAPLRNFRSQMFAKATNCHVLPECAEGSLHQCSFLSKLHLCRDLHHVQSPHPCRQCTPNTGSVMYLCCPADVIPSAEVPPSSLLTNKRFGSSSSSASLNMPAPAFQRYEPTLPPGCPLDLSDSSLNAHFLAPRS
mmetsp:Transcript_2141/g.4424  ORF Transcript_2141/g.4424 Transcript_2141/m.4424 type:complete len:209 (-) Transcript_2141:614-1240(-)